MTQAWRVYAPEWLVVFTSDAIQLAGMTECEDRYRQKYEGRVLEGHWRVRSAGDPHRRSRQQLEIWLPNLLGEYKDRDHPVVAELMTARPEAVLVARGSREERELLAYGKRRLRK